VDFDQNIKIQYSFYFHHLWNKILVSSSVSSQKFWKNYFALNMIFTDKKSWNVKKQKKSKSMFYSVLFIKFRHRTNLGCTFFLKFVFKGSFYINLTNWCHPGSWISKLIFFVDSTSNSKKKSHTTFFSTTSPFWSRPFYTYYWFCPNPKFVTYLTHGHPLEN
jgi:hypothetical protein